MALAVFPLKVQSVNVCEEQEMLYIPPPFADALPVPLVVALAEFSLKVQVVSVDEEQLYIPPPSADAVAVPLVVALTEFPLNLQSVSVSEEE